MKRSLFGYGLTAKSFASMGGWDIYDDSFLSKEIDLFGNNLLPPKLFEKDKSELEIPSPGFPPNHPLVKKALNLKSEYDYFADTMPYSIWISGTNGKTTTTEILATLLKGSEAGGNIGTPLAKLNPKAQLWVLETSSFTLHYTNIAKPGIYLLLPIKADHLSWHGGFEAYTNAKLKPLSLMNQGSVAVLPKKYEHIPTRAHIVSYESSQDLANFLGIDISLLKIKEPFLLDALLALSAQYILLGKTDLKTINNFSISPHKLQEISDAKGRLWVNDSKGTNIDATIEALKRYKNKKIHIILGGDDKGVELKPLFEMMSKLDITIYAIGSNTQKLITYANSFSIAIKACYELKEAVLKIDSNLGLENVGLLSPAAASLDQFTSYIQRGDEFMKYVKLISSS
ncbi:MAG: UDP-N-acetylmuramoyl-L-alanine--D-glutamate ligase [Campylobacteraceae bacterium]|nr:UDP-N-acetylmuramoyl-L-alanine--D-glutamate ligase [Campylobacteraceae bacterium]